MKSRLSPRTLIYVFAFLFPPLLIGIVRMFSTAGQVLIQSKPEALDARSVPAQAAIPAGGKPVALVLLSSESTQVTELLAGYQALAETGHYRMVTAAPERRLVTTTGALGVLPDVALESAPEPAVLVVPAVVDSGNEHLVAYLRKTHARQILLLGEGSSIAAQAGILNGQEITTHFNTVPELARQFPKIRVTASQDYVDSDRFFSTAGLAATVRSMPAALAWLEGRKPLPVPSPARELGPVDLVSIFLHGGYTFIPRSLGVYLSDGVDETSLAALLDTFPRTMSTMTATWSDPRRVVRSKNGLSLVSTLDTSKTAELPDVLALPEGTRLGESASKWVQSTGLPTAAFPRQPVARSALYGEAIAWLRESPFDLADTVPVVAKLTQAGTAPDGPSPLSWLYRPVLVGLAGMLVARWILGRLSRKSALN